MSEFSYEKPAGYVTNCLLISRNDQRGPMVTDCVTYLNGYAIIPVDEYYELKGEPMPDGLSKQISDFNTELDTNN